MEHVHNLVERYQRACAQYADREILGTKKDGKWQWLTYRQFRGLVDDARAGLAGLGIEPGDRIHGDRVSSHERLGRNRP